MSTTTTPPAATEAHPLAQRVAALELLVQNLVFALDAQGALNADELARFVRTATARMRETGSVPAADVAALETLTAQALQ